MSPQCGAKIHNFPLSPCVHHGKFVAYNLCAVFKHLTIMTNKNSKTGAFQGRLRLPLSDSRHVRTTMTTSGGDVTAYIRQYVFPPPHENPYNENRGHVRMNPDIILTRPLFLLYQAGV